MQPGAKFDLLWPLLDVATTLDPHLIVAYRFGAIFLSEPEAGANRTDLAIELVKRGIAANPERMALRHRSRPALLFAHEGLSAGGGGLSGNQQESRGAGVDKT